MIVDIEVDGLLLTHKGRSLLVRGSASRCGLRKYSSLRKIDELICGANGCYRSRLVNGYDDQCFG